MADIYRKSALERISNPEQLDKALTVTSPFSWLVLVGITLILVVTIIWSIVGTIPVTISATGIVASPVNTNAVYTEETGTVVSTMVRLGDELTFGTPVLTYRLGSGDVKTLYSDQVGTVSDLVVKNGDSLTPGNEVLRLAPSLSVPQAVICYVPLAQAKKMERGMRVRIFMDSADSQTYGHMEARIVNIDAHAASNRGLGLVLGTDNNLASSFLNNGPVVAVTCELYPDAETASGYYWSNEKGKKLEVSNGSLITAKVITEEVAPITKLFAKLKEIWGD